MINDKDFYAFVHLQKAAGTTLVHLLRINFFMQYCDVRVLSQNSKGVFQAEDFKKLLKINPFVKFIGGHVVKSYGSFADEYPNTKFITILRDPLKRYISQFLYKVENRGHQLTFNEFLDWEYAYNQQTKQLVGTENVEEAKKMLKNKFSVVGTVDEFDEFLILLKKAVSPHKFSPNYKLQNVGKESSLLKKKVMKDFEKHKERIINQNCLDIELYNFVKFELLPKQKKEYGQSFEKDVRDFKQQKKEFRHEFFRYVDYGVRKFYYNPIFKCQRRSEGLNPYGIE